MEESTGPTGPISIEEYYGLTPSLTPAPAPAPPITIDDLISSAEVVKKKEEDDKAILESIGNMTSDTLKSKLLSWALAGFPNVYELDRIVIQTPSKCSDGVVRNLADYIEFCSGKPLYEHVAVLQEKVTGMTISYANMGTYIAIVVTKN
jgi:hypothetical protein